MEDRGEVSEGLNEWEQIQSPCPQTRPITQTARWDEALVIVDNNFSNFAPNNHEGLTDTQQDNPSSQTSSFSVSSSSSSVSGEGDEVGPVSGSGEIGRRLRLRLGEMKSRFYRIAFVVRNYGVCRGSIWSIVSVAGVVVAALLVSVVKRWRKRVGEENKNRLMFLIREKDEKISHLLLQVAQMNEILSTRRRVPVLRVG